MTSEHLGFERYPKSMKGKASSRHLGARSSALQRGTVRLVSFDVFDTVVTRKVGEPSAIFLLTGFDLHACGIIRCTPEVFARHRVTCESRARRNTNRGEVSLREIYEEMVVGFDLEARIGDLMEAELQAERDAICAIPQMRPDVEEARGRFGRVIFISDTYLPATFLEERLQALELLQAGDRLYASSDFGVQKGDGRLFEIVLESEGLCPGDLFHLGDSDSFDVAPARALGIGVDHVTLAIPNPSEQVLNQHAFQSEGWTSHMAGAARLARMQGVNLEPEERVMWETGASVTGPLALLWALWIIDRARHQGIKQLYFLARDAYLPFLCVRSLLERQPDLDLEARYIYGSRATYIPLGITQLGVREWDLLTRHVDYSYCTIEGIQTALMCETGDVEPHFAALGFRNEEWHRQLTDDEIERIRTHALENDVFNRAIMDGIRRFQQLVGRYFDGEGLDPSVGVALIDAGWTTRSHAPLYHFLRRRGCKDVRLFYMGVTVDEPDVPIDAVDAFMFDRARRKGVPKSGIFYPRAVESLFLSDHSRTSSFRKCHDEVVAVLGEPENPEFVGRFFGPYLGGVRAFHDAIMPALPKVLASHDLRKPASDLVARFWQRPTAGEARVWSKLEWEWDPLGEVRYPLARPYGIPDAWQAFVQGRYPERHPQFWTGAALRLTSRVGRRALRAAIILRGRFKRLLRVMPPGIGNYVATVRARLERAG